MGKQMPLRMCVACREMKEKRQLIRIVKGKDNTLQIDETFKANGRGAYLCSTKECFDKCVKTRALNRALKCEISPELLAEIKEKIGV